VYCRRRVEAGVEAVKTQLERHEDSLSLLSKQMKLLRHVPLEVASLRDDLLNVIAQFPPGNQSRLSVNARTFTRPKQHNRNCRKVHGTLARRITPMVAKLHREP